MSVDRHNSKDNNTDLYSPRVKQQYRKNECIYRFNNIRSRLIHIFTYRQIIILYINIYILYREVNNR